MSRGSADLDALWAELERWGLAYKVTGIQPGAVYSGGPEPRPGVSYAERMTDHWCVEVEQDGYEPRDHWLMWGESIRDAAEKLAEWMRVRRENPHVMHIEAARYFIGCEGCERDVREVPEMAEYLEPMSA